MIYAQHVYSGTPFIHIYRRYSNKCPVFENADYPEFVIPLLYNFYQDRHLETENSFPDQKLLFYTLTLIN